MRDISLRLHSKCLAFLRNVVLVQSLRPVWRFTTPWTAAHQASLSFTIPRVCSISGPLSPWCHPTISSSVPASTPALNLSQHQSFPVSWFFASGSPKYWSFSFNVISSNEYSGLISFITDWLVLLAIEGTLQSLLQHYILKASVLQPSAFLMVQLSHLNVTTGKTRALTIWTFVSKVMSLLFNKLSRFVITFLPRSKCLLISWLQSPFTAILKTRKIKCVTVCIFSPSICHKAVKWGHVNIE